MAFSDDPFSLPKGLVSRDGSLALARQIELASQENVEDVLTGLRNSSGRLSPLLSALLSGATLTVDHQTDSVQVASGFSFGWDYRDNAVGTINDDTHYVSDNVTIGSESVRGTFGFSGATSLQQLIAINLSIHTDRTGTGAMVVLNRADGTELDFVHVNASRQVEVRTTPGDDNTVQTLIPAPGSTPLALDENSTHWVMLEIIPITDSVSTHRLVPVVVSTDADGNSTTFECDDINLNLTNISATLLGLSRSTNQIAQIEQHKGTHLNTYLSHEVLAELALNHAEDKWVFGYDRLILGGDENSIALGANIHLSGDIRPTAWSVNLKSNIAVNVVTLPENYTDYEFLSFGVVEDGGQTTQHLLTTRLLEANSTITNHRISGNDTMSWDQSARTLTADSVSDVFAEAILTTPRSSTISI